MATAMHEGTTFQQSIAWRTFHAILDQGFEKESDERLRMLANLCAEEIGEVHYHEQSSKKYFGGLVTAQAHWAVQVLPKVPFVYPQTRMHLCGRVSEGWLFCKNEADERRFAHVLREWPHSEQAAAANVVRQVMTFRFPIPLEGRENPSRRLLRFLCETRIESFKEGLSIAFVAHMEKHIGHRNVFRAVTKALGNYLPTHDVVRAAKYLQTV